MDLITSGFRGGEISPTKFSAADQPADQLERKLSVYLDLDKLNRKEHHP